MPLNVRLLREIATKLRRLRHEDHYCQSVIVAKTNCGTAACIAGWALVLSGEVHPKRKNFDRDSIDGKMLDRAGALLGLERRVSDGHYHWLFATRPNADPLDTKALWPEEYARRWTDSLHSSNGERRSRIAADLLDAIADGRVEA